MKKIILSAAFIAVTTIAISAQTQITEKNGNVGIGQTTPIEKLHVNGAALIQSYSPLIKLRRDTDIGGFIQGIQTEYLNGTPNFFFGNLGSDEWIVTKGAYNGARLFTINQNGNVGIGTNALSAKLNIKGNSLGLEVYNTQESNLDVTQRFHIGSLAFYSMGLDRSDAGKFKINYGGEIGAYNHFTMQNNGFIGLGTSAPNNNLDISNNATIRNVGVELDASHYTGNGISHAFIQFRTPNFKTDNTLTTGAAEIGLSNHNGAFYITRKTNVGVNADGIVLDKNANVGIGTTDTKGYKLAVAGSSGIIAEKVTVKLQTAWPDYVFTNKYKLPTLKEVEQHIKEKGHLKNIPSAKEVAENGVELGAMNKKLLEKVEELTLYTIQQQKQLQKQNKEIEELKSLVKKLINTKK